MWSLNTKHINLSSMFIFRLLSSHSQFLSIYWEKGAHFIIPKKREIATFAWFATKARMLPVKCAPSDSYVPPPMGAVGDTFEDRASSFELCARAASGKRKFFLRHPVDMAFERTNNCLRDTINGIWATEKWFWWIIYGTWAIEQKFWGDQNTITSLRSPQILLVPQPWLPQLLISRTGPGLIQS